MPKKNPGTGTSRTNMETLISRTQQDVIETQSIEDMALCMWAPSRSKASEVLNLRTMAKMRAGVGTD